MDLTLINNTIHAMCIEINAQSRPIINWHLLTEEELLYEVAICIFSSQTVFEVAIAMADQLRHRRLFRQQQYGFNRKNYETNIISAFDQPLITKTRLGTARSVYPRFSNRFAHLLSETVEEIYGQGKTLQQLICAETCSKKTRESLVVHIYGFGPKQASLFLRRIGYCTDLAVLDTHVLDYIKLVRGCSFKTNRLGHISFYEQIESIFREIASNFGYSIGCVDLATWLTMRVAKREGYI